MWSLTRPDAPPDEPLLVVDDRVTGATPEVLSVGVTLGMPRREAEALAPFATVLERDVAEEARRFETVVEAVEALVPRVEVVSPGLLYVPVAGAIRFYGGEEPLAERVVKELDVLMGQRRGGEALVGVADGPFAARWAAATARVGEPKVVEDTFGFLSRLDLATLRETMGGGEMIDTFRWLGLTTLGDLARLPREALASRFGGPGILAHRLASGEDRPVDPRKIPTDLKVRLGFDDPLKTLEQAAFVGRVLAERLIAKLRAAGVAPHAVTIAAESARGPRRERMWRSANPFTEGALGERVWWQLRSWVENSTLPGGIVALEIDPSDLSGEGRQLSLVSDESSNIEAERALARAQSLLGPERVLQGRPQGGRLPEERVIWSRWGEPPTEARRESGAPWPGSTPPPSPALVPREYRTLEVEWDGGTPCRVRLGTRWEPVLTWSGPWRLVGRWWWGEKDANRYQMVTSAGAFLCVVVEGKTYLAGIYD